jgi:hypothetical protein
VGFFFLGIYAAGNGLASLRVLRTCSSRDCARSRVNAPGLTQEKILEDEVVFTTGEWRTADPASYLRVDRLRPPFDFDNLVERVAVRTIEMNCRHGAAPLVPKISLAALP